MDKKNICKSDTDVVVFKYLFAVMNTMYYGANLEPDDQTISDQGDLPTLFNLHNKLDVAVAEAYNWPLNLTTDAVLGKLVELNKERAVEEKAGEVRWLREEYQSGL